MGAIHNFSLAIFISSHVGKKKYYARKANGMKDNEKFYSKKTSLGFALMVNERWKKGEERV